MNRIIEDILNKHMPVYRNKYGPQFKNNRLELILTNNYKQKEYKYLIEKELVNQIENQISKHTNLTVKGRTFQSKWAAVPWIGIHNEEIDSKAQTGIYAAMLFKADGSGVVLSIQQGTESKNLTSIKYHTQKMREFIDFNISPFSKLDMDLRGSTRMDNASRPAKYGIASVLGKEYTLSDISSISKDFNELIDIYLKISEKVISSFNDKEDIYQHYDEDVDRQYLNLEPARPIDRSLIIKGSLHPPRDPLQGKIAAEKSNYKCEADPSHKTFLTSNNLNYIEKHHLIPMKYYFYFKDYTIDHSFNIYTLCPTCHRQIHFGTKEDKRSIIEKLFIKREDIYNKYYKIDIKRLISMYDK